MATSVCRWSWLIVVLSACGAPHAQSSAMQGSGQSASPPAANADAGIGAVTSAQGSTGATSASVGTLPADAGGSSVGPSGSSAASVGSAAQDSGSNTQVDGGANDDDCEILRAHGMPVAGDTTPFTVPTGETYECFYFQSPFTDEVQGTVFGSAIDNAAIVHHFLLYDLRAAHADGAVETCLGTHPDGAVLSGWAPGTKDGVFPPDLGMAIPWGPNGRFVLEIHYLNNTGATQHDRSGAKICATHHKRPHTASISWLGTENIGGPVGIPAGQQTTVSGTCTPARMGVSADTVIHTLTVLPHMHSLGRRTQILLHRASGSIEPLLDEPFDYSNQVGYDMPGDIMPGDTLETRCTYDNTTDHSVPYGPLTTQEMCYAFVIAYPAGALDHPVPSFAGAQNTCFN